MDITVKFIFDGRDDAEELIGNIYAMIEVAAQQTLSNDLGGLSGEINAEGGIAVFDLKNGNIQFLDLSSILMEKVKLAMETGPSASLSNA